MKGSAHESHLPPCNDQRFICRFRICPDRRAHAGNDAGKHDAGAAQYCGSHHERPQGPDEWSLQRLAAQPVLADRLQKVGEYVRFNTSLDKRINEMAILMTAQAWGAQYEWYAHAPLALKQASIPPARGDRRRPQAGEHEGR